MSTAPLSFLARIFQLLGLCYFIRLYAYSKFYIPSFFKKFVKKKQLDSGSTAYSLIQRPIPYHKNGVAGKTASTYPFSFSPRILGYGQQVGLKRFLWGLTVNTVLFNFVAFIFTNKQLKKEVNESDFFPHGLFVYWPIRT